MSKISPLVRNIADSVSNNSEDAVKLTYLSPINGAPGAGQFRSEIRNRAPIIDFSNDLATRMGVERFIVTQHAVVQGEYGVNGENVYKPVNDKFDRIRIIGETANIHSTSNAPYFNTGSNTTVIEVVFWGTGLNMLWLPDTGRDARVSVDGGAESSNIFISASNILLGRFHASNTIVKVVSGLSQGLHTVRIRIVVGTGIHGFEFLNSSSTLKTTPGLVSVDGIAKKLFSLSSDAYNSTFESGVLGTKGGRVIVYMDDNGTVKKALTPTDATQLNLSNATHANEEPIRTYFWREFGSAQTSDFSRYIGSGSNIAFTADDGVTSLSGGNLINVVGVTFPDILATNAGTSNQWTFTFVGTGLDISRDNQDGNVRNDQVFIDGIDVGAITLAGNTAATQRIVSGLPYGTHTVKVRNNNGGLNGGHVYSFTVYGPKKPTLPDSATELADYNIMADFARQTTDVFENVSGGVLRKYTIREFLYEGTWQDSSGVVPTNSPNGWYIRSSASGATHNLYYNFFGSGFELRLRFDPNNSAVMSLVNSAGTTITNFTSFNPAKNDANLTFTPSTGTLSTGGSGTGQMASVSVSGLPLDTYTLKVNHSVGSQIDFKSIDIITPIHSVATVGPCVQQNILSLGSTSLIDLRKFKESKLNIKPSVTCSGFTVGNTSSASTGYIPMPDMIGTIKTNGGPLRISATMNISNNTGSQGADTKMFINGLDYSLFLISRNATVGQTSAIISFSYDATVHLPAGFYTVLIFWGTTGSGTMTASGDRRMMTLQECA